MHRRYALFPQVFLRYDSLTLGRRAAYVISALQALRLSLHCEDACLAASQQPSSLDLAPLRGARAATLLSIHAHGKVKRHHANSI